ncbi:DNA gyrase subunit A [Fibrobacter sp. UWS1]|uniref:DNA gyrase subunit A n=1 Tax=Fibrobacter sp. UWS1 TaxID=1896220 RepID=UPI000BB10598|nr:DNA gyrase subunit A [Fibrobacter sp. UWS1]PBC67866.1 DNA gyrase subunit A [Fibrobacter sp. UWS1]
MADEKIKLTPGMHYDSLIEREMQDCYLRYSMSVIVARALPDVRDGLKPVHRRVLFAMHKLGLTADKATMKSARIVGEVIGKYHPHGDAAAYDTLVRMAQDFSLRYPLVRGQGNFGSVDGDSAAAMRYTEAKMTRVGELMLDDLDKETVDMGKNYDETLDEPLVLPAALPNLLVNGSSGIAVGMATNIPPHNLREVTRAIHAYCENNDITGEELLNYVSGPDFPTGGIICGRAGIRDAYLTGRGRVRVRARVEIEKDAKGRERLIISEIPYMVNKALLVKNMADLVRDKRIDGISDIRDESDREGMRVVVDIKRDFQGDIVLNNLYKYTQLEDTFSIYNLALVNRTQPTLLPLKDMIRYYVDHRLEVILRRTQFDLKKAQARMHILEALRVACSNVDEVVAIIKNSKSTEDAKLNLKDRYAFDDIQAQAIVDMQLKRITGLEIEKLENEYQQLVITVQDLEDIIARKERRVQILLETLDAITEKFGDERRTSIENAVQDYDSEDLIPEEEQVITLSREGYVKRLPIGTFKAQNRGGKGIIGAGLKDEDNIQSIFTASTHSYLLVFTNKGRVYWTKVYNLPEGSRNGKGRPIVNFVNLTTGEKVSAIVPVRKFGGYNCLVFATKNGVINKMDLKVFSNPRRSGVNAITLDEGDELVKVLLVGVTAEEMEASARGEDIDDDANVAEVEESDVESADEPVDSSNMAKDLLMLATKNGQAITFPISSLRTMGRGTHGVRGIRLMDADEVIALLWLKSERKVLTISENGYGKRSEPAAYRITRRGGKGVRNLNITEKTGSAVFVDSVADDYDLIITSREGQVIRIPVESIRLTGRVSQGVKAITLAENDKVQDATALPSDDDIEQESAEAQAGAESSEGESPVEIAEDAPDAENPADGESEN